MKKIKDFSNSDGEMTMTSKIDYEEINKIIKLLEEKNLAEFELEIEGFKIRIVRQAQVGFNPTQLAATAAYKPSTSIEETIKNSIPEYQAEEQKGEFHFITSPMVGTFYRASAPNAPPFVEIGEPVKKKQTLCIVEAMKLMNEIECDADGVVKEIFVENGKPIEFGQKLFAIVPNA